MDIWPFFIIHVGMVQCWLFPVIPNDVCYGTLGCFSRAAPFTNTGGLLPKSPEAIGTKFLLFTRNSSTDPEELVLTDRIRKCMWKSFCRQNEIKLIIHGYMDSVERLWVKKMVRELLKHGDYNVVVVDWRVGARDIVYYQSAANARVVGAHVGQFLKIIQNVYDIEPKDIHIIGHSLGAHVAGYAGEYVEDIGRITGLDPAGPAFENTDPRVRLDPSDAIFVDVIHTDAEHLFSLGFGLKQPLGTVDFYPNGGKDQSGCPTTYFAQMSRLFSGNFEIINNVACSHLRALHFFTEAINSPCQFKAFPCQNITIHSYQRCNQCKTGCGVMGFSTNSSIDPGTYYLRTNSEAPYCFEN